MFQDRCTATDTHIPRPSAACATLSGVYCTTLSHCARKVSRIKLIDRIAKIHDWVFVWKSPRRCRRHHQPWHVGDQHPAQESTRRSECNVRAPYPAPPRGGQFSGRPNATSSHRRERTMSEIGGDGAERDGRARWMTANEVSLPDGPSAAPIVSREDTDRRCFAVKQAPGARWVPFMESAAPAVGHADTSRGRRLRHFAVIGPEIPSAGDGRLTGFSWVFTCHDIC